MGDKTIEIIIFPAVFILLGIFLGFSLATIGNPLGWITMRTEKTNINGDTTIGQYTFHFVDDCSQRVGNINDNCDGWIDGNNNIYINSGLNIKKTIEVCNHEVCHNIMDENSDIEELLCANIEKSLNHPVCERLEKAFTGVA